MLEQIKSNLLKESESLMAEAERLAKLAKSLEKHANAITDSEVQVDANL
jgi:hypothetical protein